MATISTLAVNLIARTSIFERGMKRSRKGLKGFKAETASAADGLMRFAKRLLIGGGAVLALKSFTNAASRAQETMNLFNTVFAENAKETSKWADSFARNVGRSRTEVRELAATLQDTFVPLGFARDRAAELSKTLVELGVDIASFKNIASDREVIDALTSAIVGNHRAVRRFGIVLTEGEIQLEALRAGITKNFKELTSLEKVQLRYNIILKSSRDAQGDAIKTAGNYANRVKKLKGQWVDLQEKIGKSVLPTMTRLLETLMKNKEAIVSVTKNLLIFSAKALVIVGSIDLVTKAVIFLVRAYKALVIAKTINLSLAGPVGWAALAAGVTIATAAIIGINEVINGTVKKLKELGDAVKEVSEVDEIKKLEASIFSLSVRIKNITENGLVNNQFLIPVLKEELKLRQDRLDKLILEKRTIKQLEKSVINLKGALMRGIDPRSDFFGTKGLKIQSLERTLKLRRDQLSLLKKEKKLQDDLIAKEKTRLENINKLMEKVRAEADNIVKFVFGKLDKDKTGNETATGKFQQIRSAFIDVAALNPSTTPTTELQKLNKKTDQSNRLLEELNKNAMGVHSA